MEDERLKSADPAWLDPRNDRKTPYSDAELVKLTDDFILGMADTAAWRDLVADVGGQRARVILKLRLASRDPTSLINWLPGGATH